MIGSSGWKQKSQGKDLSSNNSRLHFRSIHRLTVRIETNIPTHHKYDLELVLVSPPRPRHLRRHAQQLQRRLHRHITLREICGRTLPPRLQSTSQVPLPDRVDAAIDDLVGYLSCYER